VIPSTRKPTLGLGVGGNEMVRSLLVGSTAGLLLLGAFALAGDRLDVWEPVPTQRMSVAADERRVVNQPAGRSSEPRSTPGPPVAARDAFGLAAASAGLLLLIAVVRRIVRILRQAAGSAEFVVAALRRFGPSRDTRRRTGRPRMDDDALEATAKANAFEALLEQPDDSARDRAEHDSARTAERRAAAALRRFGVVAATRAGHERLPRAAVRVARPRPSRPRTPAALAVLRQKLAVRRRRHQSDFAFYGFLAIVATALGWAAALFAA
jgi:hypothetical protein